MTLRGAVVIVLFIIPAVIPLVAGAERSHQLLGAFFYPSFGHYRSWNLSGRQPPTSWASNFLPSISNTFDPSKELYDSNDTGVILWQLGKMKQAGVDFVASSWHGRDSYEDKVLRKIIFEVMPRQDNPSHDLRWSFVYEGERFVDPSPEDISRDLRYIKATFCTSNSILRIHGKMVLFVRGGGDDQVEFSWKWSEAVQTVGGFYLVLKVFPGSSAIAQAVDGWYEFAPANRIQYDPYYWGYASPGFSQYNDTRRSLSRNPEEFAEALQRLREANVHFALIETWNDWNQGTQIEPGTDIRTGENYGDIYIDLTRRVMKENAYTVAHQPLEIIGGALLTMIALLVIVPAVIRTHPKNLRVHAFQSFWP
jgi:hypothetical protein